MNLIRGSYGRLKEISGPCVERILPVLLPCIFVFLCLFHYASGRPFWLDENFILEKIQMAGPSGLFGPLGSQAFPRVYLVLVQQAGYLAGFNVFALRALPLVAMLAAFFVWIRIYRAQEGRGVGYVLFLLSWCGSKFMSYYASELKQYSGELLLSGLFTMFVLRQAGSLKEPVIKFREAALCFIMPFAVLFSYTAYFFLPLPAYNLIAGGRGSRKSVILFAAYLVGAIVAVMLSYNLDVKYVQNSSGMWGYWHDYFISVASVPEFLQTFTEGVRNLYVRWFLEVSLVRRVITVFLPFSLFATFVMGWKNIRRDGMMITRLSSMAMYLVTGLAVAGAVKLYPFTGARITLYIAPFIFYVTIKGIMTLWDKVPLLGKGMAALYAATLIGTTVYIFMEYVSLYGS
ncbi:MAG: hypothetical protein PHH49_08540 [Candidatus Omnitrophica bacterium]|nr:hypothetical protein [Candidatus Omnitrophota bacterium]